LFGLLTAKDADERLTALERFIEFWYGPRRPEFGDPEAIVRSRELPGSLRRFHAFAGRWPAPKPDGDLEFFYTGAGGHHLLPLSETGPTSDGRLRFFMEYQGDWYGVTTPGEPDPPVWITGRWDDEDNSGEAEDVPRSQARTRRVSATLSEFLVTHCLMTTACEDGNGTNAWAAPHAGDTSLADWFRRDRVHAELVWESQPSGCPNYDGTFYLLHGHVLVLDVGSRMLLFAALHPEGIELVRSVIGGGR
jgi:hypothetical protein